MSSFRLATIGFVAVILVGMPEISLAATQNQTVEPGRPAPKMMCRDRFDSMDRNHDGVVTMEEFMSVRHPGGRGDRIFKARDTNGDGVLTKEEFCSGKGTGKGQTK